MSYILIIVHRRFLLISMYCIDIIWTRMVNGEWQWSNRQGVIINWRVDHLPLPIYKIEWPLLRQKIQREETVIFSFSDADKHPVPQDIHLYLTILVSKEKITNNQQLGIKLINNIPGVISDNYLHESMVEKNIVLTKKATF